ncbi:MAG: primase-like DNA-binding domain-containing protein, partial [Agathobacter sp.]
TVYRFSEPDTVTAARAQYQTTNSTVRSFADECLCPWPDDRIVDTRCSTGMIYRVYVAWCKDNNNGFSKSAREFRDELSSYLGQPYQNLITRRNGNSFYKELTLTEDAKLCYKQILQW